MSTRFLPILTLLALSLLSSVTLAQEQEQELPTLVGRISLAQGDVSLSTDEDEANPARVNWPLTSRSELTTGRGARTEFRIGSTSVRLDGESALEITELGDQQIRLHLHYGSASVRIRNAEVLDGFELTTPMGRVQMRQVGRVRVDAGRNESTMVVNVFEGLAQVDGEDGEGLSVRAGRSAELGENGMRTARAGSDRFDEWALLRDRNDERVISTRYVDREMTGYEELDQYGSWSDNSEYGAVWMPRSVPMGWAPYRDGQWAYVAPWGWTWVDNASWGYAPSHYGRWVMLNQRWCWAPGRYSERQVWSPALVGWIGGSNWSLSFGSGGSRRNAPAQGWYPLAPRETYVPHYRAPLDHLRRINLHALKFVNPEWREQRRHGLTVAPHASFAQRGAIVVSNTPRAVVPPLALQNAPAAVPPAPRPIPMSEARRFDRAQRGEVRFEESAGQRFRRGRNQQIVVPPAPAAAAPAAPVVAAPIHQPSNGFTRPGGTAETGFTLSDPAARRGRQVPVQQITAPAAPAPATVEPQPERNERQIWDERRQRQLRMEADRQTPAARPEMQREQRREQPSGQSRWNRVEPAPVAAPTAPSRWNSTEPTPASSPTPPSRWNRAEPAPAPAQPMQAPPARWNRPEPTQAQPAPEQSSPRWNRVAPAPVQAAPQAQAQPAPFARPSAPEPAPAAAPAKERNRDDDRAERRRLENMKER